MHSIVIHSQNFVDPHDAETHTQNVKTTWRGLKKKLRCQFFWSRGLFPPYS